MTEVNDENSKCFKKVKQGVEKIYVYPIHAQGELLCCVGKNGSDERR